MAPTQQTLVSGMANENGVIEVEKPSVDADIDIRQDDLRLFETATKRLLLTTDAFDEGIYLEAIPTADGVTTAVVEHPSDDLTELEPADPAEQDVDSTLATTIDVRMD